jgi:DNA-directed RNA polymerase
MLVRAARRKVRPKAIRSRFAYEQLYLPWLCPGHNQTHSHGRRSITVDAGSQSPSLRKRRNSKDGSSLPSRRALATAVGYRPLDDIPFENLNSMLPPPPPRDTRGDYGDTNRLSSLKPFETSPLYLGGSLATAPQKYRIGKLGVGGALSDIESVFEACLQVGRIERAGNILRRIAKIDNMRMDLLVSYHNRYLRAALEQIMMNPAASDIQDLHKWFELEIRLKGVMHNTSTLAYMVKASLRSPAQRRERLVRRYMDMLDEDGVLQLLDAEILTAHELNLINTIYPKYTLTCNLEEDMETSEEFENEYTRQDPTVEDTPIPKIRPTEQKGLGLKSLKKTLSLFTTLPDEGIDMHDTTPEERRNIQARLEEDAVESAIDRWREESAHLTKMGLNTSMQTKSLGGRMWKWHLLLEQFLKEELVKVDAAELAEKKSAKDVERCTYGPLLRILPPSKLAAVTILSCMTTLGSMGADRGMSLSNAIMAIADSVEDESIFEAVLRKKKTKALWPSQKHLTPEYIRRATRGRGPGAAARLASHFMSDTERSSLQTQWPTTLKAKVGAFLMSALIETAKVPVTLEHPTTKELVTQMQPAFSHSHQYKMGKKFGVILANKVLIDLLKREPVHSLLAKHLPMLVQPDPWTHFNKGGFISHPSKMMRIKHGDKDQRHYAEAAIGQGDMTQTFKGLDVLGKTSWRINQPVFDIMLEAWNSGEAIANIPPETPNLPIPPEPATTQDPLERRRWIRAVKLVENARSGLHSQRCFQNFQLEIARALRNEEFYFPHNVDFRGRAYPIPPYLNHMGADHCRGLLIFGQGKELGEFGLRWLKIHLANFFGFDKASLSEREEFTTRHLEKIYDSATQPLTGGRWWLNAEDPWQCLAACIELRNALESPEPARFISNLPIHQDGTCNGLQHYAALGGDSWGAKQVNLEPGDRPADVYSAVANLVKEKIAEDKEKGHVLATFLSDKITRKTVKQTVMTNVYGVTFVGAKAQVRKQIVAAHPNLPDNEKINAGNLSTYIVMQIFSGLSSMFRGAHDIQYWFGECASRISMCLTPEQLSRLAAEWPRLTSRAAVSESDRYTPPSIEDLVQFKSSVIWTNPLHMPIVQPYRTSKAKIVTTNMQQVSLSEPHRSDPVSKRKQLQGFPPNFIHSLDATHMLLSALRCDELGLSFAAVHDSFWTHACDIGTMNTVLRDTFIRIHSEDVVGRLAAEFEARYKDCVYLAKIKANDLLLEKINTWRETKLLENRAKKVKVPRSKTSPRIDELMLEYQRMQLLRSSDPYEVEQGKKMVTPASLFEEMASDADILKDGFESLGLGDISSHEPESKRAREHRGVDDSILEDTDDSPTTDSSFDTAVTGSSEVSDDGLTSAESTKSCADEDHDEWKEMSRFEKLLQPAKRPKKTVEGSIEIWLPLTFPPVPKKV